MIIIYNYAVVSICVLTPGLKSAEEVEGVTFEISRGEWDDLGKVRNSYRDALKSRCQ